MTSRIVLTLDASERRALDALAKNELRDTRQQAVMLIRESLEQRGLLSNAQPAMGEAQREASIN